MEHLVIIIYATTRGYADKIPLSQMRNWEYSLIRYIYNSYPEIMKELNEKKKLSAELEENLKTTIETFNSTWK